MKNPLTFLNFQELPSHRLTKIVCTIGPACSSPEQLLELANFGMNIARINVSHGSRPDHEAIVASILDLNKKHNHSVAILLDTRGAEIRTGDVQDPFEITKGEEVCFAPPTLQNLNTPLKVIEVGYDGFGNDVRETKEILIDNGAMSFDIIRVNDNGSVIAKARQDGSIGSRRHINLPGADIDLPSITDKDWDDIAYAASCDIDFVALSFIRNADEVQSVRTFLNDHNGDVQIITKIETRQAVQNLSEIIVVSDGVMVARGDLGAEVPFERLPVIQDDIVYRCRDAGKPVIVATHMLESMTEHPVPTRAEVTDVAHAATEYTDATMLSGETASGKHPTVALEAMDKILRATESHLTRMPKDNSFAIHDDSDARAQAAVALVTSSDARAILVISRSGRSASRVSRFRPHVPIIAVVPTIAVQRRLQFPYAIYPVLVEFCETEDTVLRGIEAAKQKGLISTGDKIVVVSDTKTSNTPVTSIQVRQV